MESPSTMGYSGSTRKRIHYSTATGANPTSSFAYADSLNVRDSQAVRGSTTYMPDAMGVALNSSAVASHQVQLTGGRNLGSNNDNTSVIPAGTGVSVNTTGKNNIMEKRSTGENTNTLSNSRDTSNASSMGPPVAAANATSVSIAPDGAPATAQQPRRRSSSGRQQLLPHDLVNYPITVEHASGTKHKVVAMKPNLGGRKWVAADNNYVKGDITNGPPVISWYQKSPLGEKVCPDNPQFNGTTPAGFITAHVAAKAP